jgi:hypothetical protein
MAYTQMIYISRSTFAPAASTSGIEPNVAKILTKSRVNNRKSGLVGVLYYGNGHFFQCIEGEESAIDKLYETLLQDERHTDLKLLSRRTINHPSFADWSMKYVPLEEEMNLLLKANGHSSFDPYQFDQAMTHKVLDLLFSSNDAIFSPKPTIIELPAAESSVSNIARLKRWTQAAIAISVTALILSLAALMNTV